MKKPIGLTGQLLFVTELLLVVTLNASGLQAQDPPKTVSTLVFEVASLKANTSAIGSWVIDCDAASVRGRCRATNVSLRTLIANAYEIPVFTADQYISGLPGWTGNERYDLEAKPEKISATAAEIRIMLQNLLADRFKLKLREESREVAGYVLVVAKGGAKLERVQRNGTPLACGADSTDSLARCLSRRLGKPVVDKTNITGTHNLSLTLESVAEDQPSAPSIFTVLEEELGLKLEPQKVKSRMLVIDHVEKTSPN